MTGLLLGQILLCGLALLLALRLTYLILTAGINLIIVIVAPFLFIAVVLISLVTYPGVLLLRLCGFRARSFYVAAIDAWVNLYNVRPRRTVDASAVWENYGEQGDARINQDAPPPPPVEPPLAPAFDPWRILGIPRSATAQMITAAYRQKMMTNHPDKLASLDPELQAMATHRTILIKKAYDTLSK